MERDDRALEVGATEWCGPLLPTPSPARPPWAAGRRKSTQFRETDSPGPAPGSIKVA